MPLLDPYTLQESPITMLASESGPSVTILAGFADGAVKVLLHRRADEDHTVVLGYNDHYG